VTEWNAKTISQIPNLKQASIPKLQIQYKKKISIWNLEFVALALFVNWCL
jgi:hypothetical protein